MFKERYALDLSPAICKYAKGSFQTHIDSCANLDMFKVGYLDLIVNSTHK